MTYQAVFFFKLSLNHQYVLYYYIHILTIHLNRSNTITLTISVYKYAFYLRTVSVWNRLLTSPHHYQPSRVLPCQPSGKCNLFTASTSSKVKHFLYIDAPFVFIHFCLLSLFWITFIHIFLTRRHVSHQSQFTCGLL